MKYMYPLISAFSRVIPPQLFGEITPIFMLHRLIASTEEATQTRQKHIRWCLEYIRKHKYQPLSLAQLISAYRSNQPVPVKSVVFTIDDGFWDQFELAAPLFAEYDIPLTCFVITDFLDQKLWPWDDQVKHILNSTKLPNFMVNLPNGTSLSVEIPKQRSSSVVKLQNILKALPQEELYTWLKTLYRSAEVDTPSTVPAAHRPMSWSDAQQFINSGHAIASHTCTHLTLSQLPTPLARSEIEISWQALSQRLTGASKIFAYPTGRISDFGIRDQKLLEELGFDGAVSTVHRHAKKATNLYSLPRFSLPNDKANFVQSLSFIEELKSKLQFWT